MLNKQIITILFTLVYTFCISQEVLTIENAIKKGLEGNFDVLISKNAVEVASAQNNIGNAGMSPQVSLNGNYNLANVDSYQEFGNGTTQDRKGAQNTNSGASLNVNWVVFDGLKMFAVKKRLDQTQQLTSMQLKQQMEAVVYEIMLSYYDIVRLKKLISAAKQNLSIYEERTKLAQLKLNIGSDSKIDLLMTQADENRIKSDVLKLEQQLVASKVALNNLLKVPVETAFDISDEIAVSYDPSIDELKKSTLSNNSSILISKQTDLILSQSVKEARSVFLPQIQLNGAYNFLLNKSQAGFILLNKQLGINAGINASWTIFNGMKNNRTVKEKEINVLSNRFLIDKTIQQIDALTFIQFQNYNTSKQITNLENENMKNSNELVKVSLERYKLGKSNLLEVKETQKILEDSQTRYINALYELKRAETELLRANGTLVK
ncbi:MAG: TolC family protein [Sphingobacteriaceae bacterium]|jgi:outer membrane protein